MSGYAWVIIHDLGNPYNDDPHLSGLRSRVGVSGPSSATDDDILRALSQGEFFRLLDADGNAYYVGRCWSCAGSTRADMFGPLDDYGRADVGATTIQYRHDGRWRSL